MNPIVVAPGADLDQATRAVIRAVTYNSGQDCASPDCILVDNDVAELADRLSVPRPSAFTAHGYRP